MIYLFSDIIIVPRVYPKGNHNQEKVPENIHKNLKSFLTLAPCPVTKNLKISNAFPFVGINSIRWVGDDSGLFRQERRAKN